MTNSFILSRMFSSRLSVSVLHWYLVKAVNYFPKKYLNITLTLWKWCQVIAFTSFNKNDLLPLSRLGQYRCSVVGQWKHCNVNLFESFSSENTAMLSVKARFQSKPPVAWRVVGIALKQNHSFIDCIMFNIFAKNYTFEEN